MDNAISVNPQISPMGGGGGGFFFKALWGGGGGLIEAGHLFNLEMMMVSVLYKELEYKVEKLRYKKLEVVQLRIRIKSELPVGK